MFDHNSQGLKRRLAKTTFIFDDKNDNFTRNDEHNRFYLMHTQSYFNDLLQAQGFVFLNDVLKHLGIQRTMVGQIAGWRADASGFIEIKIEQTVIVEGHPKEYFLKIEHDGIIFDILAD